MSEPQQTDRRVTSAMQEFLDAVRRSTAAARDVERARAQLEREAQRAKRLRLVGTGG
ncbi:MAG TPA: hypothetical protein VFB06_37690 [Streptosporangiaceae bacterium]|nr:hypothetical protein [Streptosporangiaceae bacterium]